jgi:hypothetical protein
MSNIVAPFFEQSNSKGEGEAGHISSRTVTITHRKIIQLRPMGWHITDSFVLEKGGEGFHACSVACIGFIITEKTTWKVNRICH